MSLQPIFSRISSLVAALSVASCVTGGPGDDGEGFLVGNSAAEGKADEIGDRLLYVDADATDYLVGSEHEATAVIDRASEGVVEVTTRRVAVRPAAADSVVEVSVESAGMDLTTSYGFMLHARSARSWDEGDWQPLSVRLNYRSGALGSWLAGGEVSWTEEVVRFSYLRIDPRRCEITFRSDQVTEDEVTALVPLVCDAEVDLAVLPFPLKNSFFDIDEGERYDFRVQAQCGTGGCVSHM